MCAWWNYRRRRDRRSTDTNSHEQDDYCHIGWKDTKKTLETGWKSGKCSYVSIWDFWKIIKHQSAWLFGANSFRCAYEWFGWKRERDRLRNIIKYCKGEKTLLELTDEELDKVLQLVKEEAGVLYPTVTGMLLPGKEDRIAELLPIFKLFPSLGERYEKENVYITEVY